MDKIDVKKQVKIYHRNLTVILVALLAVFLLIPVFVKL